MFDKNKSLTYTKGELSDIFDEKGNTVLMLREIGWGDKDQKLELRKWVVDVNKEIPLKGFSFLTEEGPHKLPKVLIKNGYGHTKEIIEELSKRDDFKESLIEVIGEKEYNTAKHTKVKSKYYDPKEMLEVI